MAKKVAIVILSLLIVAVAASAAIIGINYASSAKNSQPIGADGATGTGGNAQGTAAPHTCSYSFTTTVAADCGNEGYDLYTCTVTNCGNTKKENVKPATGDHKYKPVSHDATCQTDWYQVDECEICGEVDESTFWDVADTKKDHSFNWTVTKDADCLAVGSKSGACIWCGISTTQEIPALGHDFATYKLNDDMTCTVDGTETSNCTRCGKEDTKTAVGSKLGHKLGEYISNNDKTCTKDGTLSAECERCSTKITIKDELNLATGHNFGVRYDVSDTCGHEGSYKRQCFNCNFVETYEGSIEHEFEYGRCYTCNRYKNPSGDDVAYPMGDLHFSDRVGNFSEFADEFMAYVNFEIESVSDNKVIYHLWVNQPMVDGFMPPVNYFFNGYVAEDSGIPDDIYFGHIQDDGFVGSGDFNLTLYNYKDESFVTFKGNIWYVINNEYGYVTFIMTGEVTVGDHTYSFESHTEVLYDY